MIDLRRFGIDDAAAGINVNGAQEVKEDIASLFNFVGRALQDAYPTDAARISILNLNQPGARVQIRNWVRRNDVDLGTDIDDAVDIMISNCFVIPGTDSLIGIRTDLSDPMYLNPTLLKQVGTRVFHEYAHIALKLAKIGYELDSLEDYARHIRAEGAADLFASIHGLRLGWINKADIISFSNTRAFNLLLGDVEHADFRAMDWLADQSGAADWKNMSPEQIAKFVDITAKNFMPREGEIFDASESFELLREALNDGIKDEADPKKLRLFFKKHAEDKREDINNFYDLMEDMHRKAPAQSLVHQATAKILGDVIKGHHRFLPPYPATRDGQAILTEILQRSTEKKSTSFIAKRPVQQ